MVIEIDKLNFEKARYERKFTTHLDSSKILQIIKMHPSLFKEAFYERRINNIYFDSRGFRSYFEHSAGSLKRLKVRIRWYGDFFGKVKKPILEIKIKNSDLGRKISFPLKGFEMKKNINNKDFRKIFEKSDLPEELIERLKRFEPKIINSYIRRYFISANKRYRITFDKNLSFFEFDSKKKIVEDRTTKIIELKYDRKDDEDVEMVTSHFPFRLYAYSKYISGIYSLHNED